MGASQTIGFRSLLVNAAKFPHRKSVIEVANNQPTVDDLLQKCFCKFQLGDGHCVLGYLHIETTLRGIAFLARTLTSWRAGSH